MLSTRIVGTWEEVFADLDRQRRQTKFADQSPRKGENENANEMQFSGSGKTNFGRDWRERGKEDG